MTYLPYVKGSCWMWDPDEKAYVLVNNDPFLIHQRRINLFLKTHTVDPRRHRPILCKICKRLCLSAREVAYEEGHGRRTGEAWCSDECFYADPEEQEGQAYFRKLARMREQDEHED